MTSVPQVRELRPRGRRRGTITPEAIHGSLSPRLPLGSHLLCAQVQPIPLREPQGPPSPSPLLVESQMSFPALSSPSPPKTEQTEEGKAQCCPRDLRSSCSTGLATHLRLLLASPPDLSHPSSHSRPDSTLRAHKHTQQQRTAKEVKREEGKHLQNNK